MELTINRYQPTLLRLLALILVYIGVADDTRDTHNAAARAFSCLKQPRTLPRRVLRMVQKVLYPVESATRRLIIVLAQSLPDPKLRKADLIPDKPRVKPKRRPLVDPYTGLPTAAESAPNPPVRVPRFALLDTQKRYFRKRYVSNRCAPRIRSLDPWAPPEPPLYTPQSPDDQMSDAPMMRRVTALAYALDDLPKQARRYARWRARCRAGLTLHKMALRPGFPPGAPPRHWPEDRHKDEHTIVLDLDLRAKNPPRPHDTS